MILLLPIRLAVLPPFLILAFRAIYVVLQEQGVLANPRLNGVIRGRHTAQIPNDDGTFSDKPADKDIVIFVLATQTFHLKGRFAPGAEELTNYFRRMWHDLDKNREKWGCKFSPMQGIHYVLKLDAVLGKTPTLVATEEDHTNTLVWISYWKSVEHLRAFALGDAHRAGWDWFNKTSEKKYPWIGIQYELYYAPRGHWENIAHNFKPFMLAMLLSDMLDFMNINSHAGTTSHVVQDGVNNMENKEPKLASGVQLAKGSVWQSMMSRMGLPQQP